MPCVLDIVKRYLARSLRSKHYYHKVMNEQTEAWRGEVNCLSRSAFRVCIIFHEEHVTILCTLVSDE